MKKGRHRRFEEARALKRSQTIDFDDLLESLPTTEDDTEEGEDKPEHAAWADVADEFDPEDDEDDAAREG